MGLESRLAALPSEQPLLIFSPPAPRPVLQVPKSRAHGLLVSPSVLGGAFHTPMYLGAQ